MATPLTPPTSPPSSRPTTSAAPSPTRSTSTLARAIGHAFVAGRRCRDRRGRPRHAAELARDVRRLRRRAPAEAGADVVLIGLASTDQLYFASGPPRPPGRDVHREPQPGAVQRHQDVPGGRHADRHGDRARRDPRPGRRGGAPDRGGARARSPSRTCSTTTRRTCSRWRRSRGRRLKVVVDAGNGMAGLHRAGGASAGSTPTGRPGAAVLRARRHLPEPRGQPDRAGQPGRPAGSACSRAAPTSAWPSTATPTAASWSTSAASWSRPSTLTALIAARELAKEPGATIIHNLITSRAVPEIVTRARRHAGAHPGRALLHQGRRWPRPTRSSAASTAATSTSATSGAPTPGMLAALHALAALAETDRPLSELLRRLRALRRSAARSTPRSPTRRPCSTAARGGVRPAATASRIDQLDGLTVTHADWWFNVRASNTEPLLRLNAEGADARHHGAGPRRRPRHRSGRSDR